MIASRKFSQNFNAFELYQCNSRLDEVIYNNSRCGLILKITRMNFRITKRETMVERPNSISSAWSLTSLVKSNIEKNVRK
jgi:hypothetical protein